MATKDENERLAVLETKVDAVTTDVTEIKKDVKALASTLDKKFAGKWVERAMTTVITLIITAFIIALTALVFNKPSDPQTATVTRTTTVTINTDGTTTRKVADNNGKSTTSTYQSSPSSTPGTETKTVETLPSSATATNTGSLVDGVVNTVKNIL